MPVFGLDISHHQDLGLDLARCKRDGISFVFIKATEGNTFVDGEFAANLAEARTAGLLVAAYHYVRASAGAALQVAWIQRHIPKTVPVILDVEANSGGIALTRDLVARLKGAGYRVPLLYLPRWYWQQIGSPSLAGLPPLWSSRYPDNVIGGIADEWADVPAHYWNGYGGLDVAVLQFTSSARVAGHAPLDANAYRGTTQQLAALLGGEVEDDDMALSEPFDEKAITAAGPGKLGHTLLNIKQNSAAAASRSARIEAMLAAAKGIDPAVLAEAVVARQRDLLAEVIREVVPDDIAEDVVRRMGEKLTETEGN